MEQVTQLKLIEILKLETEINGSTDPQTGKILSKGLLREVLNFKTKYWLMQLSESLNKEKSLLEKVRENLVKDIGEVDKNGDISIPIYLNDDKDEEGNLISTELHPKFIEFQEKYNELLEETKEIKHYSFTIEDFNSIESSEVYYTLTKIISKN
jgi:hypothetical protein